MKRLLFICSLPFLLLAALPAQADPVTFIWSNGLAGTTPYYGSNFLPGTNKSINDNGIVSGATISSTSYRTSGTWDGMNFASLGSLPGFPESVGNGLNNQGTVVGGSISGGVIEPTAWINGQIVDLGLALGTTGGFADTINEQNQAVGFSNTTNGIVATLWSNGSAVLLGDLPGHSGSEATDINESGTIVGYSGSQAVMWLNGQVSALPGCSSVSTAYALNDAGQAVGKCGSEAVMWANGVMTVIGPDVALGIDDNGDIVGRTSDLPLQSQTYLWNQASGLQILPGFVWSEPFSMSDNGNIVGYGEVTPEPSTMLLSVVGFVAVFCRLSRTRKA